MINFRLSEEQELIKNTAKKFAQKEIIPYSQKWDEEEIFPIEVYEKAFEAGFITGSLPEKYGGGGFGLLETCIILEEIAYGCAGIATSIAVAPLGMYPLIIAGTEEQKEKFLTPFCEKLTFASLCITEPTAGSDVVSITTKAEKKGDFYIINGQKSFITNASYADFFTVIAYTNPSLKHKGLSLFIIPKQTEGLSIGKKEKKMGQRASDTATVFFENVKIPVDYRIGQEGEGFKILMKTFDKSRPVVASMAVGVSQRALDLAVNYAKERSQFGKPIFNFQAIQFELAKIKRDIEAARLLTYKAAWLNDMGIKNTEFASMAKSFASELSMRATSFAIQVFGGYGYSREYPVEKLLRDAKVFEIYEGTNQIQHLIIARSLFR